MSAAGGLAYDRYQVNGRDEWLMRIGPLDGRPILFVPPLFEEMNRTRALIAAVMRGLAARGFCCRLPDLPGTGESECALEDCGWDDWQEAVRAAAAAAGVGLIVASIRGGALLDGVDADCHWRLSPVEGSSIARDLSRSGLVSGGDGGGYRPSPELASALQQAHPPELPRLRTVRLRSDPRPADARVDGPALWRRSEPGTSSELAGLIASDITEWADRCGAS